MNTRAFLTLTAALLICNADFYAQTPTVIEASAIDKSVEPSSVTYTARDKNIYGQPMEILVPKQFESEAGLIAVARRLAADNATFRQVMMPVQIYSADSADRELAEYFHFGNIHELRVNGSDSLVKKIIKMPPQSATGAPPKPNTFPLSRVIGQPESTVNKHLGDSDNRHLLQPSEDFAGGTQVDYPDRPAWKALTAVFYHGKLSFIQFVFEPKKPASEEEFFAELGLPKASFAVIASKSGLVAATQYRGTINEHLIEIVAWRPMNGEGFCDQVTIELVKATGPLDK